ncbi:MAG: hypothetical protein QOI12_3814 [Alphaproteobacteria bacterium]|jgi:hypothetical protein|nr:hypothetical protein [Alphaproteobacteria bacterium]
MLRPGLIGSLAAVLLIATTAARAHDATQYPDLRGQWVRVGGGHFDPSRPSGRGAQPPFTPEYQAIFEQVLTSLEAGGQEHNPTTACLPPGMPRAMAALEPMEIIVSAETTYILLSYFNEFRRVHTDGRNWPDSLKASAFAGYSIGRWEDTDGDGRYDTLAVETRGMKGPRVFEASGMPLHKDNQTVVKERISLDKANPNVLHNELTTIDNALTRPWTIKRSYRRAQNPNWIEYVCTENNQDVFIGKEGYFLSSDGFLMPTKKDQPPPDLRYFQPPE